VEEISSKKNPMNRRLGEETSHESETIGGKLTGSQGTGAEEPTGIHGLEGLFAPGTIRREHGGKVPRTGKAGGSQVQCGGRTKIRSEESEQPRDTSTNTISREKREG